MKNVVLSKEQEALLVLLRAGLWEAEPECGSLFPLPEQSWRQVFTLARMQTVTGIVYEGLCRLPEEWLPSSSLLMQWVAAVDVIEQKNRQMDKAIAGLASCFGSRQIQAVLQKGQGVARFYGKPGLRQCGDIDLYFPSQAAAKEACRCMEEQGCVLHTAPDGSVCYRWQGIQVEHHPALFDIQNPFLKGYLSRLTARYGFTAIEKSPIGFPAPVPDLLLLNVHILKHALGLGVGLRQFCDMARAYFALQAETDGAEVCEVYRRVHIRRWSRLLHSFLVRHIGLPATCLPEEEYVEVCTQPLLEIVFRGGNFGQYKAGRRQAVRSVWTRKCHTFASFCGNAAFAARYAPAEAFWTTAGLIGGQAV